MKSLRVLLPLALLSLSTAALAQSDAQKSFDTLKTLAGDWEGPVTVVPPQPEMSDGKPLHISLRVTSRGHALVHEMQESGTPLDPTKYDHPITMFYLDTDRLNLVHYCDVGNRPHMMAKKSDGKTLDFDLVDMTGPNDHGHMSHVLFTLVDPNHHIEDWTFTDPGGKPGTARFDLHRMQ